MSWKTRRVWDMKLFVELSLKDWTVLGVCLSSVPVKNPLLAVLRVLAVMVAVPAAWARL